MIDAIVVGSGPSGAMAAAALVEAGATVELLDVGATDARYEGLVPDRSFSELRRGDPEQHRYFLGEDFEGIPAGKVREVAQLTPPRRFVFADAKARLSVRSSTFRAAESLARGGLGAAWGAGVFPFDDRELAPIGLDRARLQPHYERVAARIGVSGADDELASFYGPLAARMPPLAIDQHARLFLARYERTHPRGLRLGRTWLAANTTPFRGRDPNPYHDMDFWSDRSRSVYRPRYTLDELARSPRFRYQPDRLVKTFREGEGTVEVVAETRAGERVRHRGRALVLSAGTLSTARIVLAALGQTGVRRPLLTNPYTYVPFVHLDALGQPAEEPRHSLAQLTAILPTVHDPGQVTQAQIYSYRSLMTFRLLGQAPLPTAEALRVLTRMVPLFGIFGLSHEDRPSGRRWLRLAGDGQLEIEYARSDEELARERRELRRLLLALTRLRAVPVGAIDPGYGASIHYAGCFPMSAGGGELSVDPSGRLRGTRAVYLADGSILAALPPKGLTFTIMALADKIGRALGQALSAAPPPDDTR